MAATLKEAASYEGNHVTAAETMPFGSQTQITQNRRYRIIRKKELREQETGGENLMDVCFLIEDDRGVLNYISKAHFREFQ